MTGPADTPLRAALRKLRTELGVPDGFPPDVLAEAAQAAGAPAVSAHRDATDLPFFTIDPPASTDLDQAMHLERRRHGFRVHCAIADVAAFVHPGGALDTEAHRRVTTLYFPDGQVPLHPTSLSEDAAGLLPGRTRPALLWQIDLDAEGATVATSVRRALVRSRAKLDYAGVQRQIESGTAEEPLALLRNIGRLREEQEVARGGISLNVPEQEIVARDGTYGLDYRAPLPAYGWNAQISLLTGMAAAHLMTETGTGILRTLPVAPDGAVARLRRSAEALHVDWPHHVPYAEVVRSLDPRRTTHAAFLQECTTLLRGAGYRLRARRTPHPRRPRGRRRPLHALHRPAAPPRRPVRGRAVRRRRRGTGPARVGPRRAARPAEGDGGRNEARQHGGARMRRRGRGRAPQGPDR